jgi:hypothetical protein
LISLGVIFLHSLNNRSGKFVSILDPPANTISE